MTDTAESLNLNGIMMEDLPDSLRDIAELIGLDGAIALVSAFGGTKLKFPMGENNNQSGKKLFDSIAAEIGIDTTRGLIAIYGGTDQYIPMLQRLKVAGRTRRVITAYDAGKSVRDIALEEGVSYRTVQMMLKRSV